MPYLEYKNTRIMNFIRVRSAEANNTGLRSTQTLEIIQMDTSDFNGTFEEAAFLAKNTAQDARGLAPYEVLEILQEAFDEARLNQMQATHQARGTVRGETHKLELHEVVLRRADAIQKIIEGGRMRFDGWCIEQQMHPGEASKLFDEAMAYIRELTDASAEDHLATARARYEDIFQKLLKRAELKEAAMVQAKLDKLNQLGSGVEGDTLGILAKTIEKLSRNKLKKPVKPESHK